MVTMRSPEYNPASAAGPAAVILVITTPAASAERFKLDRKDDVRLDNIRPYCFPVDFAPSFSDTG